MSQTSVLSCYQATRVAESASQEVEVSGEDPFVAALARGEASAVRFAYRQHHEAVRAFARRLLGADDDAEELVQETFIALPAAARGFRGEASLRTFIISVAVGRSRNLLRSRRRRKKALERFQAELGVADGSCPAPDAEVAARQLLLRIGRAMESLSEDQRLAFVLVDVEERSSQEAAEILESRASTVRARVSSAREQLRKALERSER